MQFLYCFGPDPALMGGQAAGTWAELCRSTSPGTAVDSFPGRGGNLFYQFPIKRRAELTFSGSRSEGVCWPCVEIYLLTLLLIRGMDV